MIIKFFLIIYLLFILFDSYKVSAQELAVQISNLNKSASLVYLEGEKIFKADSLFFQNGSANVSLKGQHHGFYRIHFDERLWIDFLYAGDDVEIKADYNNIHETLEFIASNQNRIYHEFRKLNQSYKTKTELLQLVLARYPKDDEYYLLTKDQLAEVQKDYLKFVDAADSIYPGSFISRYMSSAQLPTIPINTKPDEQLKYLQSHALNNIDFNDAEMIYSDLFASKSIEYLMYYRNPQLPKALLEKEFMKAVDSLLYRAKVNDLVYQHITEYLVDGFKSFGFDTVIDYILDNYVIADDICLDEKLENSIHKRIEQSKKRGIGSTVPNIELTDVNGSSFNLEELNSQQILLLFYSSQCTHCMEVLPELSKYYNVWNKNDFEVLAISLDEAEDEWKQFVEKHVFRWINVRAENGWESEVAQDYFIYATPTMFLLDKNKKIIAKPITMADLQEVLN